jgi:hypothetical protein
MPAAPRRTRVIPAPFNPRQYGATFWIRADQLGGNGASISAWTDMLSAVPLVQATGASQPTVVGASGPKSTRPAASYDGGDVLSAASISMLSLVSSNQCHIYIVQIQTGSQANHCTINWNQGVSNLLNTHLTFSDTLYWDFGDSNAGSGRVSVAQPSGWDDKWHLIQLIREPPDSGTSRIRVDGAQVVSGSVTKTLSAGTATLNIGGGNNALLGSIAEIIICNVAHPDHIRLQFERYFNQRYWLF